MAKGTTYDKTQKSAGDQTRIEDCFASKYGVDSGDVDDTFISDKLEAYVDSVVKDQERKASVNAITHTPIT